MDFLTPTGHAFKIPDDWWTFAEMDRWTRGEATFYPAAPDAHWESIAISDIEPPTRAAGVSLFKKYKLVPILFALQSPECALPPLTVVGPEPGRPFRYRVHNGFHRYYASVAAGYPRAPAAIIDPATERELQEALGVR